MTDDPTWQALTHLALGGSALYLIGLAALTIHDRHRKDR